MKEYYLSSRYRFLYSVSGIVESIIIALLLYPLWLLPVINILLLVLIGFIVIYSILWARKEYLSISREGIAYRGPDVVFTANWDAIKCISHGWSFPFKMEGITVDKSSVRVLKMGGIIKQFPFWGFSQNVFIPLECFAKNWPVSELGQQIKQYASHLFV